MYKYRFIGVQTDLRPISPSLKEMLKKIDPFERVIIRGPFGLVDEDRPLQFSEFSRTEHLDIVSPKITLFIGAPDLIDRSDWTFIPSVIARMKMYCSSICFEAMQHWNDQFDLAYSSARIADFSPIMVEGIPSIDLPEDVEILLQSQRYVNNLKTIQKFPHNRNVILRRDALIKYPGVFRRLKKNIESLDELQGLIENTGAKVYRYP